MVEKKDISALISLLDDPDEEVNKHVEEQLISYGEEVVPVLEDHYIHCNETIRKRLDSLIEKLQIRNLSYNLQQWAEGGAKDLLEGIYLINKIGYPHLKKSDLTNTLDKVRLDSWLEMHSATSPYDQVKVLNHIIFNIYEFQSPAPMKIGIDHYYLNRVLEEKTGNPLSIGILYSLIAQRLNIPIFGVNLPHHFVLAYKELANKPHMDKPFNEFNLMDPLSEGEVLFYINPYNKGTIFSKWNIDRFLKQVNIAQRRDYYHTCSHLDTILRVLRNMEIAYDKKQDHSKVRYISSLIGTLQPYAE